MSGRSVAAAVHVEFCVKVDYYVHDFTCVSRVHRLPDADSFHTSVRRSLTPA